MNQSLVRSALNTWKRRPFDYADCDCCQFVAHILLELTGRDYRAGLEYNGKDEAEMLIAKHGGLAGLMCNAFGVQPSTDYCDGDPVMVTLPIAGDAMGIKLGASVVCLTKKGFATVPNKFAVKGWSICRQ
jgi:hypothetical protein